MPTITMEIQAMRFPSDQPPCHDCFDVDHEGFEQAVIEASHARPILVDFWANWCAPCHQLTSHLYRVIDELQGAVGLAKVEVDEGENMKLAGHFRLRGFPTVLLFRQGEERGYCFDAAATVRPRACGRARLRAGRHGSNAAGWDVGSARGGMFGARGFPPGAPPTGRARRSVLGKRDPTRWGVDTGIP